MAKELRVAASSFRFFLEGYHLPPSLSADVLNSGDLLEVLPLQVLSCMPCSRGNAGPHGLHFTCLRACISKPLAQPTHFHAAIHDIIVHRHANHIYLSQAWLYLGCDDTLLTKLGSWSALYSKKASPTG